MPPRRPVPPELLTRPFTTAEASAAGLSKDVLAGARFWAPARGVHAHVDLPDCLELRCRALSLIVPKAVVSHSSAARLRGLPLPGQPAQGPIEVTTEGKPPRHAGVLAHQASLDEEVVVLDCGVRATTASRTWADLACRLSLDDLVILGDAVLRHGWAGPANLTSAARRPNRRGAERLRAALPPLEARTDSPMETRLRLIVIRAGLARPVANRDVVVDGCWLARPDLSWPDLRIAVEYDGDHHRLDRAQWQRDIGRRRLLEDAGWLLVVVTADDVLRHPDQLVDRLRRLIVQRRSGSR